MELGVCFNDIDEFRPWGHTAMVQFEGNPKQYARVIYRSHNTESKIETENLQMDKFRAESKVLIKFK